MMMSVLIIPASVELEMRRSVITYAVDYAYDDAFQYAALKFENSSFRMLHRNLKNRVSVCCIDYDRHGSE